MVWTLQKCYGFVFLFRGALLGRTGSSSHLQPKTYFTMARGRAGGGGWGAVEPSQQAYLCGDCTRVVRYSCLLYCARLLRRGTRGWLSPCALTRQEVREVWQALAAASPDDPDRFCDALSGGLQLCARSGGFVVPRGILNKLMQVGGGGLEGWALRGCEVRCTHSVVFGALQLGATLTGGPARTAACAAPSARVSSLVLQS
jgi:hypothetical protein